MAALDTTGTGMGLEREPGWTWHGGLERRFHPHRADMQLLGRAKERGRRRDADDQDRGRGRMVLCRVCFLDYIADFC